MITEKSVPSPKITTTSVSSKPTCRVVRPGSTYAGKQGLNYFEGIAAETVGSTGICMHLLTIPPGARAKAAFARLA